MKITIDISDANEWIDEDTSLDEAIKTYIQKEVLSEIWKRMEKRIEEQITLEVSRHVEKNMYVKIQSIITDIIENDTITPRGYWNNQPVSVRDYIKNQFEQSSGWSSPQEKLKQLWKAFWDEMKSRYDIAFASQIVSRMQENWLLKDEVAKLLIK